MVSARILLVMVLAALLVVPALGKGVVMTVDQGQPLDAEKEKHPIPMFAKEPFAHFPSKGTGCFSFSASRGWP